MSKLEIFARKRKNIYSAGPPTAPQRHIQQVARLGEEVKLVCPMDGRPAPFIEWYR